MYLLSVSPLVNSLNLINESILLLYLESYFVLLRSIGEMKKRIKKGETKRYFA